MLSLEGTAGGGPPTYLLDGVLPTGEALHFPRDVSVLPDGRLMVTDSGCRGAVGCEEPTAVWIVELPAIAATGLDGVWTPDGQRQAFGTLAIDEGPWFTDATLLYSADWVGAAVPQ